MTEEPATHRTPGGPMNQTTNTRGEWVPAIPLPLLGLRKRCSCGRRFWTLDGYRGHYAYAHILGHGEAR